MALNEVPFKRKALSARKSIDCQEFIAVDAVDILNGLPKCSGSASNLSTRAKRMQQKKYFDSLLADLSQAHYKMNCIIDQKSFLNACQILEKLSKIICVLTSVQDRDNFLPNKTLHHTLHLSCKKIQFYHDMLKRLLEERCSIVVNEECKFCIKQTQKVVDDFRQLYRNEKLKMKTMPVQSFNRFVDSSDISIFFLENLLKRIQMISDLHLSLKSNFQKITNISHVGFNLELYQTLLKTLKILHDLNSNLFYWCEKNVNIFLKKLCLADSNLISPEFLGNVVELCNEFNRIMLRDKKQITFQFFRDEYFSDVDYKLKTQYLILQHLSHFEAKVASERIVHFLNSECKRSKQEKMRKKNAYEDIDQNCSSTSDYCSANASDFRNDESVSTILDASKNFRHLLASLMQRSQTLVLKYLYSITKLKSASLKREKYVLGHIDESSVPKTIRHSWLMPEFNLPDDTNAFLEDKYWTHFWNKLQKFIVRSLSEVPHHQYGDATAGAILLWPDSYLCKVSEILRITVTNEDILSEGRNTIKQIYNFILIHTVHILWDKRFSSTVSAMHLHLCIPVPTVSNGARTYPGNLFCNCVEILMQLFQNNIHCSKSISCLKSLQQLQTTLDSFILWTNTKTRALVSKNNLPAYLLICCFDCKWALNLLKNKSFQSSADVLDEMQAFISTNKKIVSIISKQIEFFEGYLQEASYLLHFVIFTSIKNCLCCALESKFLWKSVFKNNMHFLKQSEFATVEEILIPLTEITNKCNFKPVVSSIVSAVSQAFLFILNRMKRKISTRHIQILIVNFKNFFTWFCGLQLKHTDRGEIAEIHFFQKICCIMKLLEATNVDQWNCLFSRNRVSPIQLSEIHASDAILNDQEKLYWRTVNRPVCLMCC